MIPLHTSRDKRSSREHERFVSFGAPAIARSALDDGKLVSVYLSYNSHKSLRAIVDERSRYIFPQVFIFPRATTMRRYFSATEYKLLLRLLSVSALSRAE